VDLERNLISTVTTRESILEISQWNKTIESEILGDLWDLPASQKGSHHYSHLKINFPTIIIKMESLVKVL
jgi:hypothetical protein